MATVDPFWVRGVGLNTFKSKGSYELFTIDDLWDLAKQVEVMGDNERIGSFLPQYSIPFFTDKYASKYESSHNTLCAVVGEDRLRILVEPQDTKGGDQIKWCKENNVPLYCFASGYITKKNKIVLSNFNLVLNKASCVATMAEPSESNEYFERDVMLTYPIPEEYNFGSCIMSIYSKSDENALDIAKNFFYYSEKFLSGKEHLLGYKKL